MKKLIAACFVLAAIASCNSSGSKEKDDKVVTTGDINNHPDYKKGLELVANNKCMTCHAVNETITGPPYM
jgi:hypothetical protein